uniref:Phage protein n=1 Tax=Rhabditophanes sp. KR3021 TaxID=114890 RepID=A0AC35U1Q5_9BILA
MSGEKITITLDSLRDPNTLDLLKTRKRLSSFRDWPYDGESYTSLTLALNGFMMTSNESCGPSA